MEITYIFDRFYRCGGRTGQGLFMGLSIVKEIAETHQGTVEMSSIPYQSKGSFSMRT
ncbi:ATP-binding protein [Paenibacillus ferrarius]|uniref:ATP-binding protein n=1 Tax=Paenibacillus ferrarius TaxID=1469647 RepID=UPI0031344E16